MRLPGLLESRNVARLIASTGWMAGRGFCFAFRTPLAGASGKIADVASQEEIVRGCK